jgi:hypothetical protein
LATTKSLLQDLFEDPTAITRVDTGKIGEGQTNDFNFLVPPRHLGAA